ncbi:MAG TPA: hypothetical protein VI318_11950 [Baekduia sp.]
MEAATEDELRLARRLKLGVRLVVYPVLLGLIVLALHARAARSAGEDGGPALPKPWVGKTAQRGRATVTVDGGLVVASYLDVRMRCDDGSAELFTWTPVRELFVQRGDRVTAHRPPTARSGGKGWRGMLEGWLDLTLGRGVATGTVRLAIHWTHSSGTRLTCRSGPVPFSARRGAGS